MLTKFPGNEQAWLDRAGTHSAITEAPEARDERLVFAVLEAIGYECWKYGDAPNGPADSEETLKAWLVENRDAIGKMKPDVVIPDFLSLACGVYNFIFYDGEEKRRSA